MRNKVLSITEKVPQPANLADGFYEGIWGGHVIEISRKGKIYNLETEVGVKGIGYKVVVEIKDGVATFEELNQ